MRQDIKALNQLARIAIEAPAAKETLAQAAGIIRQATGAAQATVVYAEDQNFLTCSHDDGRPCTEMTLAALAWIQRHAAQAGGPVAFNLVGRRVEDFTSALSADDRQFLAFTVPTTESAAEMCVLRGAWERKDRARVLRFMESATPALTLILEHLLNANRSQRLGEQLHTLANAAQMLTRSEDVKAALIDLATAVSASTGFEYLVNIDLYDAATNRFFLRVLSEQRYTGGTLGQIWGAGLNPDQPDPWNVDVMTTLRPVLRPDMQNDPVYPEHVRKFFAQSLLRSTADFPLLFQDEFLGTIAFVSFKPRTFPPDEVSLLQGFASQVAMALKALRMHKEVQRYAQELKRSADEYIATTNLTGDIICRLDEHGDWTFLNDGACQFYGRPREELLGTDSRAFLHPDDLEPTDQAIRQMRAKRALTTGFVNRQVTPMGTRVVEWNGYPLFDEDGQYTAMQITGRDITERKQMEEALRESEERFRSLSASAPIGVFLTDLQGDCVYANPCLQAISGLPLEQSLGYDWSKVIHPDDRGTVVEAASRATRQAGELSLEFRILTPKGKLRWVHLHSSPVSSTQGEQMGRVGTMEDTTERKQMEDALRDSEERYRDLFENASDLVQSVAQDGAFVYVNRAWQQALGYSKDEIAALSLFDIIHPDSKAPCIKLFQRVMAGEKVDHIEAMFLTKDGRTIWVEGSASCRFEDGKPVATRGIFHDITERKKAEGALREAKEFSDGLITSMQDGCSVLDSRGVHLDANPAFCQMTGFSREELIGAGPPHPYWPPEAYEEIERAFRKTLGGRFAAFELTFMRKNGERFPVIVSPSRIRDSQGNVVSYFATVKDITGRKRAEEEREKALHDARERMKELACMYRVADLSQTIETMAALLQGAVTVIPSGWQYPEITRAKLSFDGQEYISEPFEETPWKLSSNIAIRGEKRGAVEVYYLEERPERDEGPFMQEERDLIDGLARILSEAAERKQAEETLRESEARYKALFAGAPDGMLVADSQTRQFRYANPAMCMMFGYTEEEFLRIGVADIHPKESLDHALADFEAQARGEKRLAPGLPCLRKDGTLFYADIRSITIVLDGRKCSVGIFSDVTERKRMEEERERLNAELEVRAITDGLTGLYNHAHFFQRLAEEIERSKRYGRGVAVVMMDVDDFKRYNDSRGHQAGDAALRLIADCVRTRLRRSDIAFRYGGDEFAAILLHADSSRARAIAKRIDRLVTRRLEEANDPAAAWLGLSAGVACFPDDATSTDDLVKVADAALYDAKRIAQARTAIEQAQAVEPAASPSEVLDQEPPRVLSVAAEELGATLQELSVHGALSDLDLRTVAAVATAAEIKDSYIRDHQQRASQWAAALAKEMGLPPEQVQDIRTAGLLHDLGKVSISEHILNKPGKLTEEEYAQIKEHSALGAMIVAHVEGLQRLVTIVRHHHERFDGKGYPDGLAGEDIPLEARILSVVDVFDAMTHERSYRKALSRAEAIGELQRGAGTQFDPVVVKAFLALLEKRGDELACPVHAASKDRQLVAARVPTRGKGIRTAAPPS